MCTVYTKFVWDNGNRKLYIYLFIYHNKKKLIDTVMLNSPNKVFLFLNGQTDKYVK
jgi:hypothetical protein